MLAGVTAVALVTLPVASVLAAGDTGDSVKPANTPFTDKSTKTTFTGKVGTLTVTSTCTSSVVSGRTPASGLALTLNRPTFTGCTDNLKGKDTVTTTGTWKGTYVDAANDEAAERNPDGTKITVPKAGATVRSSVAPACVITVAPNGPASITASYNDTTGVATFKNALIPSSTSAGCPGGAKTGTATFNASYKSTPVLKDGS